MKWYERTTRVGVLPLAVLLITSLHMSMTPHAYAADDKPELHLSSRPITDTYLQNGLVIAHGRVICSEAHNGFQVWLNAPQNGSSPYQYVINGKNDSFHQLRVRIEQEGWAEDIKGGKGIIKLTGEEQVNFDIVVDGAQDVMPDQYIIVAEAVAMLPWNTVSTSKASGSE